jgi:hypothetical protein
MSVKGPQSNTAELAERYKFAQYSETAPLSPLPQVGGSGTLNPLRRWPFNMQQALFVRINGEKVSAAKIAFGNASILAESSTEVFIFSEASPIVFSLRYQIGPFVVSGLQAVMNFPSTATAAATYQIEAAGDYNPVPTIVMKNDSTPFSAADLVGSGAGLHCKTSSGAVRVKGFPFIVDRPLPSAGGTWTYVSAPGVNTTITEFTRTTVTYHGLAASPNGFVPFNGSSAEKALTPVILLEADYTDAIRDNKNLIETTSANYRVVGIWQTV